MCQREQIPSRLFEINRLGLSGSTKMNELENTDTELIVEKNNRVESISRVVKRDGLIII